MRTLSPTHSQPNTGSYHLWFKPSGAAYAILARTIRELAQELNGPVFEPHVSLIGNLGGTEQELAQRTKDLAQQLQQFKVVLTEPSYRDDHFHCLFMLVEQTPAMMNAFDFASDFFFQKPNQAYVPHVSLAYGFFPDSGKKQIIGNLPPEVRTCFDVTTLYLIRADTPDPKNWHEIAASPVAQPGRIESGVTCSTRYRHSRKKRSSGTC